MGFVVCCNFVFICLPYSYVLVRFVLMFAIVPCQYILSHTFLRTRAHVLRLRPSGGEIRSTKTCAATATTPSALCVIVLCF